MSRKHYWKLPVIVKATRAANDARDNRDIVYSGTDIIIDPGTTAVVAQARDWIDLVRQRYGDLLRVYGSMVKLAEFARLMNYVVITPDALQTVLPPEAMPAGLDRDQFVQAFAGMMQNVIAAVPDELTALMMKNSRGGLE